MLGELSILPIVTLVGDVIILHNSLGINGERETFSTTEILSKTRSCKWLCKGAMLRELDHNR